jgi:hypothetical protein
MKRSPSGKSIPASSSSAAPEMKTDTEDFSFASYIPDEFIPVCNLEGCVRKAYVEPASGEIYDYCGRTHANLAKECRRGPEQSTKPESKYRKADDGRRVAKPTNPMEREKLVSR